MRTHVGTPRILGDGHVIVVGHSVGGVVHDVLEDGSEPNGVVDLGLLLHNSPSSRAESERKKLVS